MIIYENFGDHPTIEERKVAKVTSFVVMLSFKLIFGDLCIRCGEILLAVDELEDREVAVLEGGLMERNRWRKNGHLIEKKKYQQSEVK